MSLTRIPPPTPPHTDLSRIEWVLCMSLHGKIDLHRLIMHMISYLKSNMVILGGNEPIIDVPRYGYWRVGKDSQWSPIIEWLAFTKDGCEPMFTLGRSMNGSQVQHATMAIAGNTCNTTDTDSLVVHPMHHEHAARPRQRYYIGDVEKKNLILLPVAMESKAEGVAVIHKDDYQGVMVCHIDPKSKVATRKEYRKDTFNSRGSCVYGAVVHNNMVYVIMYTGARSRSICYRPDSPDKFEMLPSEEHRAIDYTAFIRSLVSIPSLGVLVLSLQDVLSDDKNITNGKVCVSAGLYDTTAKKWRSVPSNNPISMWLHNSSYVCGHGSAFSASKGIGYYTITSVTHERMKLVHLYSFKLYKKGDDGYQMVVLYEGAYHHSMVIECYAGDQKLICKHKRAKSVCDYHNAMQLCACGRPACESHYRLCPNCRRYQCYTCNDTPFGKCRKCVVTCIAPVVIETDATRREYERDLDFY